VEVVVLWRDLFSPENDDLHKLAFKGLIRVDGPTLIATSEGILALRQIAKTFDRYLRSKGDGERYSQAV
ncbi:MAG: coproporphyrinogen III oxidase, partial [Pseudomonadota bacterium]